MAAVVERGAAGSLVAVVVAAAVGPTLGKRRVQVRCIHSFCVCVGSGSRVRLWRVRRWWACAVCVVRVVCVLHSDVVHGVHWICRLWLVWRLQSMLAGALGAVLVRCIRLVLLVRLVRLVRCVGLRACVWAELLVWAGCVGQAWRMWVSLLRLFGYAGLPLAILVRLVRLVRVWVVCARQQVKSEG